MLDILAITSPIYAIILLGFATTRMGLFAKADMRVFGKFVVNLALPALIFRALSQRQFGEIFNQGYLLAYLGGSLATVALGYLWSRRVAGLHPVRSTFYAMGMGCSNSGFVGYPILLLTFAPMAGVALALNMLVENLVIIPLLLLQAERGRGGAGGWAILRQSFDPCPGGRAGRVLAGLAAPRLRQPDHRPVGQCQRRAVAVRHWRHPGRPAHGRAG
jgi:malonate transporter